jgi:2-octaprenyl-6-methoxyphenol hydroxylase
MKKSEIAIIGAGIIGMTCALQLSKLSNINITLYGKAPRYSQHKTTAILETSFGMYKEITSLNESSRYVYKLDKFKIIDQLSNKNKILDFDSNEINLNSFAYNIKDNDLSKLLNKEIEISKNIKREEFFVKNIKLKLDEVMIETLENKKLYNLIIGADGRNSLSRDYANIDYEHKKYKENILVTTIDHINDHQSTSYEIHKNGSLLTSVPLSKKKSAIVYINDKNILENLIKENKLQDIFNLSLRDFLGEITINSDISQLPSEVIVVKKLAKNRTILVGESAHVIPPLGAQGLNLGIRDIKEIFSLLKENNSIEPGSKIILNKYNEHRWLDIYKRQKSVNILYNSMMGDNPKYQLLRNIGFLGLNKSKILRKILLNEGLVLNANSKK